MSALGRLNTATDLGAPGDSVPDALFDLGNRLLASRALFGDDVRAVIVTFSFAADAPGYP